MKSFLDTLREQRWDDHRYYHQSRINQSLHLVSALCFLCAYVLLFTDPVVAALIAWLVSMTTRQAGHFFFEPKGYDTINQATHEHKEAIKVGYNLRRKVVLLSIWAAAPVALLIEPTLWGMLPAGAASEGLVRRVGMVWLALGIGAVLFRMAHLLVLQGAQASLAWGTKLLTDPFHDIRLYWKSPWYVLKGQLIDPMPHVHPRG